MKFSSCRPLPWHSWNPESRPRNGGNAAGERKKVNLQKRVLLKLAIFLLSILTIYSLKLARFLLGFCARAGE